MNVIALLNKLTRLFILIVFTLAVSSCAKECDKGIDICQDEVPNNEPCEAYYKRWFYNKKKNRCDEISYSGCTEKGFATKIECEQCECD